MRSVVTDGGGFQIVVANVSKPIGRRRSVAGSPSSARKTRAPPRGSRARHGDDEGRVSGTAATEAARGLLEARADRSSAARRRGRAEGSGRRTRARAARGSGRGERRSAPRRRRARARSRCPGGSARQKRRPLQPARQRGGIAPREGNAAGAARRARRTQAPPSPSRPSRQPPTKPLPPGR